MPLNQFTQKPIKGQVDQTINPSIHTFQSDNVADLVAGDLVTVKASPASRVPLIVAVAAASGVNSAGIISGVVTLSPKQDTFKQTQYAEVALPGSVAYVQFSAAAVAANVEVAYSAKGVFKAAVSTDKVVGVTWNDVASGGIGRIMVLQPYVKA